MYFYFHTIPYLVCMKKILFTIFLACNVFVVFGQNFGGGDKTITLGISGGSTIASFFVKAPAADQKYVYNYSAAPFSLGLFADIPFSDYFSVRPSLFYQGMGSEVNEEATYYVDEIYKLHYMEIPVAMVAHWPLNDEGANIFIGGGPFAAYALNGTNQKTITTNNIATTTIDQIKFGSNGDFKTTNFGLTTLLGYQTASGISIGLTVEFGATNILQKSDLNIAASSAKTNVVYFSLGQSF
jgi:hypothetical protein